MKKIILFVLLPLSLAFCDPGHNGIISIKNNSNDSIVVSYVKTSGKGETISRIINPNSILEDNFSGLGKAKNYDCCPCEYQFIKVSPTNLSKTITKDISKETNWNLDKSEIKTFKKGQIKCTFTIEQSDITP